MEADAAYAAAEIEPAPAAHSANTKLFGPSEPDGYLPPFALEDSANTMAGALNSTLREALSRIPNAVLFGEDVEDPKGGVFGFTKGLSTRFPGRVVNSPLAEATIAGMGVGLAATGFRPILEMQFIDFIAPAFNQLLNQAATLRWRSNGDWTCPAVFYAPYGAYLPAGSTWHSQSNEGFWTHIPGLRVAVPSTPADLAGLLWSALQESDPTLLLIPKHIMRVRHDPVPPQARGFGRARTVQIGNGHHRGDLGQLPRGRAKGRRASRRPLVDRDHRPREPGAVRLGGDRRVGRQDGPAGRRDRGRAHRQLRPGDHHRGRSVRRRASTASCRRRCWWRARTGTSRSIPCSNTRCCRMPRACTRRWRK